MLVMTSEPHPMLVPSESAHAPVCDIYGLKDAVLLFRLFCGIYFLLSSINRALRSRETKNRPLLSSLQYITFPLYTAVFPVFLLISLVQYNTKAGRRAFLYRTARPPVVRGISAGLVYVISILLHKRDILENRCQCVSNSRHQLDEDIEHQLYILKSLVNSIKNVLFICHSFKQVNLTYLILSCGNNKNNNISSYIK